MAAFSYQYQNQSLLLDPASCYIQPTCNSTINGAPASHQPGDLTNVFLNCYYSPDDQPIMEVSDNDLMTTHESNSSVEFAKQAVLAGEEVETKRDDCSVVKKRKNVKQMFAVPASSNPLISHDMKEGKRRKQKKCSNGVLKNADEEKQLQMPPPPPSPPTGYIHVRARRGQATDSHSLAERVRREKISERMKLLQGLVPGCDKVIGKALMLDEIINYVQSLQNQVEFLSMKLASVSPNMYEFGMHLDDYFIQTQKVENMSSSVTPVKNKTGQIQPTAFVDTTDNYSLVDTSVPFMLHGQGPTVVYPQEQVNLSIQVDGQSLRFLQQLQLNNNSN